MNDAPLEVLYVLDFDQPEPDVAGDLTSASRGIAVVAVPGDQVVNVLAVFRGCKTLAMQNKSYRTREFVRRLPGTRLVKMRKVR